MKSVHGFLVLIVLLAVSGGRVQRNPVSSPEIPAAQTADPVLLAAGDIANCGRIQDESTAQLLDGIAGTVVTLGDNAYPDGTLGQFTDCYGPTWPPIKVCAPWPIGTSLYTAPASMGTIPAFRRSGRLSTTTGPMSS